MNFYSNESEFNKIIDELEGGFIGQYLITEEKFISNVKNCKKNYLAKVLIDQHRICSGVGNYLLSEIFYACKLNPNIRCSELSDSQIKKII